MADSRLSDEDCDRIADKVFARMNPGDKKTPAPSGGKGKKPMDEDTKGLLGRLLKKGKDE